MGMGRVGEWEGAGVATPARRVGQRGCERARWVGAYEAQEEGKEKGAVILGRGAQGKHRENWGSAARGWLTKAEERARAWVDLGACDALWASSRVGRPPGLAASTRKRRGGGTGAIVAESEIRRKHRILMFCSRALVGSSLIIRRAVYMFRPRPVLRVRRGPIAQGRGGVRSVAPIPRRSLYFTRTERAYLSMSSGHSSSGIKFTIRPSTSACTNT